MIPLRYSHETFFINKYFNLQARRHKLFRTVMFVLYMTPCMFQIGLYRNLEGGPLFVKNVCCMSHLNEKYYSFQNFPTMKYLIENPKYRGIAYDMNAFPEYDMAFSLSSTFVSFTSRFSFDWIWLPFIQVTILPAVLIPYFVRSVFLALVRQVFKTVIFSRTCIKYDSEFT